MPENIIFRKKDKKKSLQISISEKCKFQKGGKYSLKIAMSKKRNFQ